jgi:hypothetical protein
MATLASFLESTAFGALNNFLSGFHNDNGYALPSRYDVIITSPGEGDARKVSMRCETIDLPGQILTCMVLHQKSLMVSHLVVHLL